MSFTLIFVTLNFFLSFLSVQNFVDLVEKSSWKNPLKIDLGEVIFPQWSIQEIVLSSTQAGLIDDPREVIAWVTVKQTQGSPTSFRITPGQLYISLWNEKKKVYEFVDPKVLSVSTNKYQILLPLPPVNSEGMYTIHFQFYNDLNKDKRGILQEFKRDVFYQIEQQNFIFLVDNSGSMHKNDPMGKRLSGILEVTSNPNMVKRIREIAIFVFSDRTELVYRGPPNITQPEILRKISKQISQGGTDIAGAMSHISQYIKNNPWSGEVTLIFLTDGVPSTLYGQEHMLLKKQGVSIFSVGLSAPDTQEYDQLFLQKIATQTGGQFISSSSSSVREIYQQILQKRCNLAKKKSSTRLIMLEEVPFLRLFDVEPNQSAYKILVDGQEMPLFWKQEEKNTVQLGFFPMNLGIHLVQVLYTNKLKKQKEVEVSFHVVEKYQVYQITGNFFRVALLRNQVLRIPFSLRNLQSQSDIFSITFLNLKGDSSNFSARHIFVEHDHMSLSAGGVYSNSIEIRVPSHQKLGEYHGYFLVRVGTRTFIKEISFTVSDTIPVPVITKSSVESLDFFAGRKNDRVMVCLLLLFVGIFWAIWPTKEVL